MEDRNGKQMPNTFSSIAGLLVLLLAFVLWMCFGPLFAALFYTSEASQYAFFAPIRDYLAIHIPFVLMFLGLLLGSNLILKTKLRELTGGIHGFRWRYAGEAAAIYLIFSIALTLIHFRNVSPSGIPLSERLIFVLPVLMLTPIQTVSEEIFFRTLPARIAYKDKLPDNALSALPYALICGFLFLLPHLGNPEIRNAGSTISPMLYYFIWGSLAAFISAASGGFEASIAMHSANNLYIALIANYPGSAMPTDALLIDSTKISGIETTISAIAVFALIYAYSLLRGYIEKEFIWPRKRKAGN